MSYNKENIRTYGIVSHVDSGKTTFTERVLFYTGKIHKMGEVHEGNTIMDFDPRERARGITINSAAISVEWKYGDVRYNFNVIETCGHIDLNFEVERSLRVLDGAICLLDSSQGVEPQTEQVWRQADKYNVARIIFVNKMDKIGADFSMSLQSLKDKLGITPVPIQIPYGEGNDFKGIIDLVDMKLISFNESLQGKEFTISDIPDDFAIQASSARDQMLEQLSVLDDNLCERYLDGRYVNSTEAKKVLRKGTIARQIYPVLCGSALRNKGVQMVLDAVVHYLPSPLDLPPVKGINPKTQEEIYRQASDEESLSALAFKVVHEKNGTLTYLRIYSGILAQGLAVYNPVKNQMERINRLCLVHADVKENITIAGAGSIVAAIGLKNTHTGDTLCLKEFPILLEQISRPETVVEQALIPKSMADLDKLSISLQKLLIEDPSLQSSTDSETGQIILKGMGELHLEVVADKLRSDFGIQFSMGNPSVAYKETITKAVTSSYTHKHQSGGHGQFAHVVMDLVPGERGSGLVFNSEIMGGVISKEYIPAIERGVKNAMTKGILAGYPTVDVIVTVVDGSMHCVDSSSYAFEMAGCMGFQQGVKKAQPALLEPFMKVEITSPEQYMGDVIGLLSQKSGQVKSVNDRGNAKIIEGLVPLRKLFGFTSELRSLTQGRANNAMMFAHYDFCSLPLSEIKK